MLQTRPLSRKGLYWVAFLLAISTTLPLFAAPPPDANGLAAVFARDVDRRLAVPPDEARYYGNLLRSSLSVWPVDAGDGQIVLLVDRSPLVQALLIYWYPPQGDPFLIGASPVSTGRAGGFEHFLTPLGVFEHTLQNPDFRAEGTRNQNGIRGYGIKGMRVFDFGWQAAPKTWGNRAQSVMRLQIHATDPDRLESRLGSPQSKGCIRIPASLNLFLDQYGLLDADYERAAPVHSANWVLHPRRTPTPWSGRYLVVVESPRSVRPVWSPVPATSPVRNSALPGSPGTVCG